MEHKLYLYTSKSTSIMNIQADLNWIQKELKEVKDPTLIEVFKNLLKYRKKVKDALSKEQKQEEALMVEAEADIKAGRVYSIDEAHKIIDNWK